MTINKPVKKEFKKVYTNVKGRLYISTKNVNGWSVKLWSPHTEWKSCSTSLIKEDEKENKNLEFFVDLSLYPHPEELEDIHNLRIQKLLDSEVQSDWQFFIASKLWKRDLAFMSEAKKIDINIEERLINWIILDHRNNIRIPDNFILSGKKNEVWMIDKNTGYNTFFSTIDPDCHTQMARAIIYMETGSTNPDAEKEVFPLARKLKTDFEKRRSDRFVDLSLGRDPVYSNENGDLIVDFADPAKFGTKDYYCHPDLYSDKYDVRNAYMKAGFHPALSIGENLH